MTGGRNDDDDVQTKSEIILPGGQSCSFLKDIPSPGRQDHTLSGYTVCGGRQSFGNLQESIENTCHSFKAGKWELTHNLAESRFLHVSWNSPSGVILMGPGYTTEKLSNTSNTTEPSFNLVNKGWIACAIELEDTVVVTGGDWPSVPIVQVYNINGHQEQLPNMTRPRSFHACGHYVDSNNKVVSAR